MEWTLAIVAAAVLAVAAFSRLLTGSPVTTAMVFVVIGLTVGPKVLGEVDVAAGGSGVRTLAEAALALVLFCDASRIDARAARSEFGLPARLLGIGLPLTIALGALVAALIFGELTLGEALILGVILAPTDAALGAPVVTEPSVPTRIREGLNVESGLNDGICVPLLFAAIATADVESEISHGAGAVKLLVEEIGYGVLGGVAAAILMAVIVIHAGRRNLIDPTWQKLIPLAGVLLAYGIASPLNGSGFIAAFVAGIAFRRLLGRDPEEMNSVTEQVGTALSGVTLLLFGAVLLGPALGSLDWKFALYAVLSLTVVRMLPVAVALIGSHARLPTLGFVGWFGPRGLASIVFGVILVEESQLPQEHLLLVAIYLTIGLSVFAHGITAAPGARRYAAWFRSHPRDNAPPIESVPTEVTRTRRLSA